MINITDLFPDINSVNAELYPDANALRPELSEYADGLDAQGRLTPIVVEAIAKARRQQHYSDCQVYIAGGLTGVSEGIKERYASTSQLLAKYGSPLGDDYEKNGFFGYVPHLHGTDPVKHPDVSPEEVRDIDFLWSSVVADLHINYLSPVAHGNAIEEAWAESRMIPTIYMNPAGNPLSRLTKGMHNILEVIEYPPFEPDESADGVSAIESLSRTFDELHRWLGTFPERDPREFHYNSFRNLAMPALIKSGLIMQDSGAGIKSFEEHFDPADFAIYDRSTHSDTYGKLGRIVSMHEHAGVTVVFEDGKTRLFDQMQAHSLSLWPLKQHSYIANTLGRLQPGELPDPE